MGADRRVDDALPPHMKILSWYEIITWPVLAGGGSFAGASNIQVGVEMTRDDNRIGLSISDDVFSYVALTAVQVEGPQITHEQPIHLSTKDVKFASLHADGVPISSARRLTFWVDFGPLFRVCACVDDPTHQGHDNPT